MLRLLLVSLLLATLGCSAAPRTPTPVGSSNGPGARETAAQRASANAPVVDYAPGVPDARTWSQLAARPERSMVARTEVVKVIIDLEDDWRTYFLQSQRWEIHYFFARAYLSRPGHVVEEHGAFNEREYRTPDRRFVLGSVVHYLDADRWTFELVAGDTLDIPRTARAFQTVRRQLYIGDRLAYRPVPAEQDRAQDELRRAGLPVLATDELFHNVRYQPVVPGEAVGFLRFVRGEPGPTTVRRTDIVVLDSVPLDIPVCSGIVTAELQAPLAHVALLASNRRTPDMALRGGFDEAALRRYEGQLVRLRVRPQEWTIEPVTQAVADAAWLRMRPAAVLTPPLVRERVELLELARLERGDVGLVGAKAAQLGSLARMAPHINVPAGFALTLGAFREHLQRSGIDAVIRGRIASAPFQNDPTARAGALAEIRGRIVAAPVEPTLLARLHAQIVRQLGGSRVRLRSSTNIEDLPGFNGAGLYRSLVLPAQPTLEQLADGLRAVWASTYSFQAYEERSWFRVDESRVAMGVLVQQSIDDDVVNGVAITANPFDEGRPALFMNVQVASGEGSAVTGARGGDVPEQVLYYTYNGEMEFERLSRSSRTGGANVLSNAEIYDLSVALRVVQSRFNPADPAMALDVEFILSGPSRRLVFVQARPYQVHYDEGQGWAQPPAR